MPALVDFLRRDSDRRGLLVLGPLPPSSAVWAGLQELDRRDYCTHVGETGAYIDCRMTFEELVQGLPAQVRREQGRKGRRLRELSGVRFVRAVEPPDVEDQLEVFLAVEASGWKGERGTRTAIALDPRLTAFYRALATIHGDGARLEVGAIYAEGRCITARLCLRTAEECTSLKTGYDEEYGRVSPGQCLLERTLEECCEDPEVERLNLVFDAPRYRAWNAHSVQLRQVHVAIGGWSSRFLIALVRFRFGPARTFVQRLRGARARTAPREE
jgi:CelD/BcsL family acetyltransferase involved in cellulose biosynthesis